MVNDQLLCGLALGACGAAAIVFGTPGLATAALAAAIPFLAVGLLLTLGAGRNRVADFTN